MVNVKVTLKSRIPEISRRMEKAAEPFPESELYTDEFISHNTDFQTFDQMAEAGGLDKVEDINGEAWSQFVAAHSRFGGWAALREFAIGERLRRKIGLQLA